MGSENEYDVLEEENERQPILPTQCDSNDELSKNVKCNTSPCGPIPIRLVLVLLCTMGCFVAYSTRVTISMALVCMVNQTAVRIRSNARNELGLLQNHTTFSNCPVDNTTTSLTSTHKEDGPFIWEEELQGIVLSAFFWGYVMTQFLAGILSDKFGAKWILGIGLLVNSVVTMLLPFGAHYGSVYYVILLRFLAGLSQGPVFPSLFSMMAKWFPQKEKTLLLTASTVGCSIGVITTYPVSAYLCTSGGGWERIFYFFGGFGLVWFVLWTLLTTSTPSHHTWISVQEKNYIEANTRCSKHLENVRIPWKKILSTPAFLSICILNLSGGIKFFMLLTQLPTYLKVVMGFSMEENGLVNVFPNIMGVIVALSSSAAADLLKNTKRFRLTTVRKSFTFAGSFTSCTTLIALTFVGCDRTLVVALLWISMSIDALNTAGVEVNPMEMAPNFAGTVTGITNSCSAVGGIFAPYIVGVLTQADNSKASWNMAFYLSSGIGLFGLSVYLWFGSAETQPWNECVNDDSPLIEKDELDGKN